MWFIASCGRIILPVTTADMLIWFEQKSSKDLQHLSWGNGTLWFITTQLCAVGWKRQVRFYIKLLPGGGISSDVAAWALGAPSPTRPNTVQMVQWWCSCITQGWFLANMKNLSASVISEYWEAGLFRIKHQCCLRVFLCEGPSSISEDSKNIIAPGSRLEN